MACDKKKSMKNKNQNYIENNQRSGCNFRKHALQASSDTLMVSQRAQKHNELAACIQGTKDNSGEGLRTGVFTACLFRLIMDDKIKDEIRG